MNNAIYVSINPKATKKIEDKIKNYEFRNYIPKQKFNRLYVYVTSPICELKYIMEINNIIVFPEKIIEHGDGNEEFNNGLKTKYAYQINKVYKLSHCISLKELKEKYQFIPPQSFAYKDRYLSLTNDIEQMEKTLIWER